MALEGMESQLASAPKPSHMEALEKELREACVSHSEAMNEVETRLKDTLETSAADREAMIARLAAAEAEVVGLTEANLLTKTQSNSQHEELLALRSKLEAVDADLASTRVALAAELEGRRVVEIAAEEAKAQLEQSGTAQLRVTQVSGGERCTWEGAKGLALKGRRILH